MSAVHEYRQPDADGRIPLSQAEYEAIRTIYGAVNSLTVYHGDLERRCSGIKNGWRDLRCLVALSTKVLSEILRTVPVKKLRQMRKDLQNTICIVKTKGVTGEPRDGFMYVEEDTIVRLAEAAAGVQCFGCDRCQQDAKQNCQLFKDVQSILNYELAEKDGPCQFSQG